MRDFLNIGSSPCDENCVELGSLNYGRNARAECLRFIDLIKEVCGNPPEGSELAIKAFPHDFGTYYEVVCYFDDSYPDAVDYAFHVEGNSPLKWGEEANSRLWKKE